MEPRVIIVMEVSGTGKSTVAAELAQRLGWAIAEGDDFHSESNVAKMRAGHALTDADRGPWLDAIETWIGAQEAARRGATVSCSALKRRYRDRLRRGHDSVLFVHLIVAPAILAERMTRRTGHFMPPALLSGQLAALEPLGPDEPGITIDGTMAPAAVVTAVLRHLSSEP